MSFAAIRLPLLGKELRQLLPIGLVWLLMVVLQLGWRSWTERLDEHSFEAACEGICFLADSTFLTLITLLYVLVTTWLLFPRENDERTIDHLRSLPVNNLQIFASKIAAAWLLLIVLDFMLVGFDHFAIALNPQYYEGKHYPLELGKLLGRDVLFYFIIICHGLIVSWFRSVGLIAYGIVIYGLWFVDARLGGPAALNILNFYDTDPWSTTLRLANSTIAVQFLVALMLLPLAYRLWMNPDNARQRAALKMPRWLRIGSSLVLLGVLGIGLNGMGRLSETVHGSASLLQTEHYRLAVSESNTELVEPILEYGDSDLEFLAAAMGADIPADVLVDTTAGESHVAGLAMHGRIRMSLDPNQSDLYNRFVLAHETVHVLQSRLSDGALSRNGMQTQFFIEGSAQYFAHQRLPDATPIRAEHAIAAMAAERENIRFGEMANSLLFNEKYDATLHYMLGELWVESLARVCGESTPSEILVALGDGSAPNGLNGETWWRTLLAGLDCNLADVNRDFEDRREAILDAETRALFPEFGAISRRREDGYWIIEAPLLARDDTIMPPQFWLRTQPSGANVLTPATDHQGELIDDGDGIRVRYTVPLDEIDADGMRYQLGYDIHTDAWSYFTAWRRG